MLRGLLDFVLIFCYLRLLLLLYLTLFLCFPHLLSSIQIAPDDSRGRLVNIPTLICVFSDSAGLGWGETGLCRLLGLVEIALGSVAVGTGEGAGGHFYRLVGKIFVLSEALYFYLFYSGYDIIYNDVRAHFL